MAHLRYYTFGTLTKGTSGRRERGLVSVFPDTAERVLRKLRWSKNAAVSKGSMWVRQEQLGVRQLESRDLNATVERDLVCESWERERDLRCDR